MEGPARASVVVVCWLVMLVPVPARAAASCTFDSSNATVDIAIAAETAVLWVDQAGDIRMDDSDCGASVTSADAISVTGAAGSAEGIDVDITRPFAPGATPEPSGVPEIELSVTLEGDEGDALTIRGGPQDDAVTAGTDGIDLSLDDDVDVQETGASIVLLAGGQGNDALRGDGGGVHGPSGRRLVLDGGAGEDTLIGGDRRDALLGADGGDRLDGRGDGDVIDGGEGRDVLDYAGAPLRVEVDLSIGRATGWGADRLSGIEDVIGSPGPDRLFGDQGPNALSGGPGRDRITGYGGDNVLDGGWGKDFIKPGPDSDRVVGSRGSDTVSLRSAAGPVRINLSKNFAVGEGNDVITGVESAVGSRFDDVIRGTNGRNRRLVGSGGDDRIYGRGGPDRLRGGPGADVLFGGTGDDELAGGARGDVLHGGPGDDTLSGGPGIDTCAQNAGSGPHAKCEASKGEPPPKRGLTVVPSAA